MQKLNLIDTLSYRHYENLRTINSEIRGKKIALQIS